MRCDDPKNRTELHFVYLVYGADDALLYVGCTRAPWQRFNYHRSRAPWHSQAERVEWIGAGDLWDAQALEREIIRKEEPPFNRQHNQSYWLPPSRTRKAARDELLSGDAPAWLRMALSQGACPLCADAKTAVAHPRESCMEYARDRLRVGQGCPEGMEHAMRVIERAADKAEAVAS